MGINNRKQQIEKIKIFIQKLKKNLICLNKQMIKQFIQEIKTIENYSKRIKQIVIQTKRKTKIIVQDFLQDPTMLFMLLFLVVWYWYKYYFSKK
jgi:hypothetical protein